MTHTHTHTQWTGWYGFNAGSTLCTLDCMALAGKVAVTTTLAPAAASLTVLIYSKFFLGYYDLALALNGVVAGLVSITAPCSVVEPWAAFLIGIIGAFVFIGSDKLLLKFHVDDPLQASALHGFCGAWGLLAVGIFGTDANVQYAAYPNANTAIGSGEQFAVQLIGVLAITAWVSVTTFLTFLVTKYTIGLRVDDITEEQGLDSSEHGSEAYVGFDDE